MTHAKLGCLNTPSKIEGLTNMKILKVSCGEVKLFIYKKAHSLALTHDNKVYGWGFTSNGQLGLGKNTLM